MQLKLLFSHIIIFIISFIGLTQAYQYIGSVVFQSIYAIFHLIIVFILYFLSGFWTTEKSEKFDLKKYYIIAGIGFLIWFFAVINSPSDLNWKSGNGGIFWFIYRIYISGIETPFNEIFDFSIKIKNVHISIALLLIYSIIPSVLQAFGGLMKINTNKKSLS